MHLGRLSDPCVSGRSYRSIKFAPRLPCIHQWQTTALDLPGPCSCGLQYDWSLTQAGALLSEILAATSMCHSMGYLGMHKAWEEKVFVPGKPLFHIVFVPCSPCVAFNKLLLLQRKWVNSNTSMKDASNLLKSLVVQRQRGSKSSRWEENSSSPNSGLLSPRPATLRRKLVDFAAVLLWLTSWWLLGNWPSHVVEDAVSSRAESIFLAPNVTAPARSERVHTVLLMFRKLLSWAWSMYYINYVLHYVISNIISYLALYHIILYGVCVCIYMYIYPPTPASSRGSASKKKVVWVSNVFWRTGSTSVALAAACWAPFHAWPGCFQLQDFFLLISWQQHLLAAASVVLAATWQRLLLPWQQPFFFSFPGSSFCCLGSRSPPALQQLLLPWQQPVGRLARLFPALSLFSSHFRKQRQARNGLQMFPGALAAASVALAAACWAPCQAVPSFKPFFFSFQKATSGTKWASNVPRRPGSSFCCLGSSLLGALPGCSLLQAFFLFTPGQAVSSFKTFFFLFQKATSGTKWASNVPRRPGSSFCCLGSSLLGAFSRLARLFPASRLFSSYFRKQRQARNGLQMFPGALAAASVALAAACWAPCQAVPSFKTFFFLFQKATSGTKWTSNVPRRPGSSFCCFGNSAFGALPGCSQL